jgi:N6-adenosine-specific RNA methylase IME4
MSLYRLIYADPPWRYADKAKSRIGAERHYPTASMDIIAEHLDRFVDPSGCSLAIWCTHPLIFEQGAMLQRAGWTHRTILFDWIKVSKAGAPRMLAGHHTRSNSEVCYLWTKGANWPRRVRADVSSVILAELGPHSRKPVEARQRLELLYGDVPRIELYNRGPVPGWDWWGSEGESLGAWAH